MLGIRNIVLLILGLTSFLYAQGYELNNITRYKLNQSYGIFKSSNSEFRGMSKYLLVKYFDDNSGELKFKIIDSIISLSTPQLCDSTAISFIGWKESDSAMLLVKNLETSNLLDTIITYPIEEMKGAYFTGQKRLYNLNNYIFHRPDSILFWLVPYPNRTIMEIGKILPNKTYITMSASISSNLPTLTEDFSLALYSPFNPVGIINFEKSYKNFMAYDFELDSSYVIRYVRGVCGSPKMLNKEDQLFCLCSESIDESSVCLVKDSIPYPLFSVEFPVTISGYDLYQDSIVIKTSNCYDKEYGIKSHTILR